MFSGFSSVGFSGSRSLSGAPFALCRALSSSAAGAGLSVLVGCAAGADRAARLGAPSAVVFRVVGSGRSAFVSRSCRFVRALSVAPSPVLVSFPGCSCPAGLRPAASWVSCGSGSWSSAALAVGLGVPLVLFLPAGSSPPWGWGAWVQQAAGLFAGGWLLRPAQGQRALF